MKKTSKVQAFLSAALGAAAILAMTAPASAEGEKEAPVAKKAEAPRKSEAKVDAVSNDPQLTTASFGDWIERCQRIASGSRLCEVAETVQVEGQNAPLAQMAVGRPDRDGPLRLTVVLPVNVSFPDAPKLKLGGGAFDLSWRRCIPGGCIADAPLSEADVATLRATAEPGQIEFKTASGQDVKFPTSSRGLQQALDALRREPVAMNESKPKP